MGAAQDFVRDAFSHLKTIGFTANTQQLFAKAGLDQDSFDEACIQLTKPSDAAVFIDKASKGKFWPREPSLRPLPKSKQPKGS
jgi:catalase